VKEMTKEEVEEENDSMNDKEHEVNNEVHHSGVKMIVFYILLEEDGNFVYKNFVHRES